MFEAVELGRTTDKQQFKTEQDELRQQLLAAQLAISEANISVVIIISGVIHAGKGEVVNYLHKWFDSRGLQTHAFWDETDEEKDRPPFWRYWRVLPPRGQIAIMFGGWYTHALHQHTLAGCEEASLDESARRIDELEQMLTDSGTLIIKLWCHLSKKTYQKRNKLRKKSALHHEISPAEKQLAKCYDEFVVVAERMIRMTDTGLSPWHLIESDDENYRNLQAGRSILQALTHRLSAIRQTTTKPPAPPQALSSSTTLTILDRVDLTQQLTSKDYRKQLSHYQALLKQLSWQAYVQKRSTVAVFEGWDAAGKGGAIRRITSAIDARLVRSISIAAPTDEERSHHYLWRFWRHLPRAGYITLYDRSWYGRVLVERVESFAQAHEWMRAYQEINDFEEQLVNHGIVMCKFWVHISPEQQLQRFEQRQQIPWKQHKITEEDWRNRDKWEAYKYAVNEMAERTSTAKCPWTIVAGEDKYFARIEIIKTLCERLTQALGTD